MKTLLLVFCLAGPIMISHGQSDPSQTFQDVQLSRSTISLAFSPQVSWYSNSSAIGSITYSTGFVYTYYLSSEWQFQFPVSYVQQRGQDILVRCSIPPCTGLNIEKTGYVRVAAWLRRKISGNRNGQLFLKGGPFIQRFAQRQAEVDKYATLLTGLSISGEFTYQVLPMMDIGLALRTDCSLSDVENPQAMDSTGEPFYAPNKGKAVSSNLALEIGLTWFFKGRHSQSKNVF